MSSTAANAILQRHEDEAHAHQLAWLVDTGDGSMVGVQLKAHNSLEFVSGSVTKTTTLHVTAAN